MYKSSTYFIKAQIHNATQTELTERYKRALEDQSVNNISVDGNTIKFTNNIFRFVLNRFANKFSGFSEGQIRIVDEEKEFGIYFKGNLSRLFVSAAIIAVFGMLFLFFGSGFSAYTFIAAVCIFILFAGIGYISILISFPVYFESLRNDIERELQNKEQQKVL